MKETIAFIGAGNVAWHLSHALDSAGYTISGIASKSRLSAKKLAMRFRSSYAKDPADIIHDQTCLFITTPDAAIAAVANHLCKEGLLKKGTLVVHTNGLYGTRIIKCVTAHGSIPLAMHPASSFSSRSFSKNEFRDVWFALQGSASALKRGKQMVRALKGRYLVLSAEKKPLYHLALVFASNLLVGIEDMAVELLSQCGMTTERATQLILPLVSTTVDNIREKGTEEALSGPIERGDTATIKRHLAALSKQRRAYRKTYLALSKHLIQMVKEKGDLPKETIRALRHLFKD